MLNDVLTLFHNSRCHFRLMHAELLAHLVTFIYATITNLSKQADEQIQQGFLALLNLT